MPQESEQSAHTQSSSFLHVAIRAHRLATSDITGVLALGVVGLAEEVVDPLKEVLEREALGESLAGLAVGLVARAGSGGDRGVEDGRGEGAGDGRDVGCGSLGGGRGVVGGAA